MDDEFCHGTTTDTYTVTEMGPKFGLFLDKERGTSLKVELGVTPALDTKCSPA